MDGESHGRAPCIFQVINDVGILLDDAFAYVFNHGDIKMLRERERMRRVQLGYFLVWKLKRGMWNLGFAAGKMGDMPTVHVGMSHSLARQISDQPS